MNRTTSDAKEGLPDFTKAQASASISIPEDDGKSALNDTAPPIALTAEKETRLYRKIDLRLIPVLTLLQLLSAMDRGNMGNAKIQGLITQLDLGGSRYNISLSLFFLPYILLECPSSLVTKKFRPSRWLPGLAITWGIIMTFMGFVRTYPQLVGTRVLLGATEAGLFPGIIWYLSMWYPRNMLQLRVGIFWSGSALAGAFSGLLAFAVSFMAGDGGKEGWSWIFIIEGLATVTLAIFAAFIMVDLPRTAKFLTAEERAYVLWKQKYELSTVGEEENFAFRHLWSAIIDWQTWVHAIINAAINGAIYSITYFLPTIIDGFGFSSTAITQLLTVPQYICAGGCAIAASVYSDKLRLRSPFILLGFLLTIVGYSILLSGAPSGVRYFGTFCCVCGPYTAHPGVLAWLSNNMTGHYKRGMGLAIMIAFGNFLGSMTPLIFRQQDAPKYVLAYSIEIMYPCLGIISVSLAVLVYSRLNAKQTKRMRVPETLTVELVDGQLRPAEGRAPDFRYIL